MVLKISQDCAKLSGEQGYGPVHTDYGCVTADLNSSHANQEDLLSLVLAARHLNAKNPQISVTDLSFYRREVSDAFRVYNDAMIQLDPLWSPDGNKLLFIQWQQGRANFKLTYLDSDKTADLPPLSALPSSQARWSSDSRHVAYASLNEIVVYDTKAGTSEMVTLSEWTDSKEVVPNDLVVSFSPDGGKLFFAFDQNYYSDYKSFILDIPTNKVALYKVDNRSIPIS